MKSINDYSSKNNRVKRIVIKGSKYNEGEAFKKILSGKIHISAALQTAASARVDLKAWEMGKLFAFDECFNAMVYLQHRLCIFKQKRKRHQQQNLHSQILRNIQRRAFFRFLRNP